MPRSNRCLNPALGANITGWSGGGPFAARRTVTGISRPFAYYDIVISTVFTLPPPSAFTVGETWTCSVYVRAGLSSCNALIKAFYFDSGGAEIVTSTPVARVLR